jgi:hypothetical protein
MDKGPPPSAQPRFGLNRPPKWQDVHGFPFLPLSIVGRPSGNRFFVNRHDLDARRNYSLPSTRHTGVDNTPVGNSNTTSPATAGSR